MKAENTLACITNTSSSMAISLAHSKIPCPQPASIALPFSLPGFLFLSLSFSAFPHLHHLRQSWIMTKDSQLGKLKQRYCPEDEHRDELTSTDSDGGQDDSHSSVTKSRPSKAKRAAPRTIPSPCNPTFHECYGVETSESATTNGKVTRDTNTSEASRQSRSKSRSRNVVLRRDQNTPSNFSVKSAETSIENAHRKRALNNTRIANSPINNKPRAESQSREPVGASSLEVGHMASPSEPDLDTESSTASVNSCSSVTTPGTPKIESTVEKDGGSHFKPFLTVLGRTIYVLWTFLENVVQNKHVLMTVGILVVVWILFWQSKTFFHPILEPLNNILHNVGDGLHYMLKPIAYQGYPCTTVSQSKRFVAPILASFGNI